MSYTMESMMADAERLFNTAKKSMEQSEYKNADAAKLTAHSLAASQAGLLAIELAKYAANAAPWDGVEL